MKFSVEDFRNWEHKKITLLGMSGVGKTYISSMLRSHGWFHYSGDYRIGTRYLDEAILDMIGRHRSGRADLALPIWTVYNAVAWFDHWIDKKAGMAS